MNTIELLRRFNRKLTDKRNQLYSQNKFERADGVEDVRHALLKTLEEALESLNKENQNHETALEDAYGSHGQR